MIQYSSSEVKYTPLDDKTIINDQNSTTKSNTTIDMNNLNKVEFELLNKIEPHNVTQNDDDEHNNNNNNDNEQADDTKSRSFKFKNESNLFNVLPNIKFKTNNKKPIFTSPNSNTFSQIPLTEAIDSTAATATTSGSENAAATIYSTSLSKSFSGASSSASTTAKLLRRRTILEKLFLLIIIILLFSTISLIVLLMFKNSYINYLDNSVNQLKQNQNELLVKLNSTSSVNKNSSVNSMCLTDKCILLSGNILNAMNIEVDPCDDFYEYACGNWLKQTLIPRGYPRWSTIVSRTYSNQLVLKDELERYFIGNKNYTINRTNLIDSEIKAVAFYKSCVDNDGIIEKRGSKPLIDLLNRFMYKNTSNNNLVFNETFKNLLYMAHIEYGLNALFQLNVMDDDKNSSFNDIEVI